MSKPKFTERDIASAWLVGFTVGLDLGLHVPGRVEALVEKLLEAKDDPAKMQQLIEAEYRAVQEQMTSTLTKTLGGTENVN